jgi:hypothetical protein
MATTPSASTSVETTAAAAVAGLDTVCVIAPVPVQADITPRQYGSPDAVAEVHGYSEGVEYCSFHTQETRKPYIFIGVPIDVLGTVGRKDVSGNSDTSVADVTAGADGSLTEHEGVVNVIKGGTVGTDQIVIEYSLDGGLHFKKVKLGDADEYAIPNSGLTLSFGTGDLTAGDTVLTWSGTGPVASTEDIALARTALASQLKSFRSIMVIGDVADGTDAAAITDEIEAYETENQRFVYARLSVPDRLPLAEMSHTLARMTGAPTLTFETTGDTIARATGSWIADGFQVGDTVTFSGTPSASNDFTAVITVLSATTMTTAHNLVDQVTALASCVGYPTLTFLEVGASGDTLTRNRGSWLADGFRAGDLITVDGTSSNDDVLGFEVQTATALVLTMAGSPADLDNETISTQSVTVSAGQTKAEWVAELEAEFAEIVSPRVDLSLGRARKASPYSGFNFRRPASWVASLREYQHDLHIATWWKKLGPTGWTLNDADGNLVEYDDRVDGGAASAAQFTSLRTWSNGPAGSFVALSLTRESEAELTSRTHNAAVVNLACATVQLNTELVIGQSLVLNDDGTATEDSLSAIELQVNSALANALLASRSEGPRASKAVWSASRTDVLNVPEAELTGVLDLNLRGTIHKVTTKVRIRTGGA